jgi:hypothetical protein
MIPGTTVPEKLPNCHGGVASLSETEWENAPTHFSVLTYETVGQAVSWWLRHCAASRKVAGSRPGEVNDFFFQFI